VKPVQVASAGAVPLPRVRPGAREAQPITVASVSTAASPAEVVRARGLWTAAALAAAEAPASSATSRGAQTSRTQGQPEHLTVTRNTPTAALPRLRPGVALVSALGETSAAVPPWPINSAAREEQPSPEMALAFAASEPVYADVPAARASPMGALRPNSTVVARSPAAPRNPAPRTSAAQRLVENPWLRGIMLAPSVHETMDVGIIGRPDTRALAPFMQKPRAALAMRFSEEPEFEADAEKFSGNAVAFLPTIVFGAITAGLN